MRILSCPPPSLRPSLSPPAPHTLSPPQLRLPPCADKSRRPRVIMRRQKTFQLCLNSYLFANMICDRAGPKDVRFTVAIVLLFFWSCVCVCVCRMSVARLLLIFRSCACFACVEDAPCTFAIVFLELCICVCRKSVARSLFIVALSSLRINLTRPSTRLRSTHRPAQVMCKKRIHRKRFHRSDMRPCAHFHL